MFSRPKRTQRLGHIHFHAGLAGQAPKASVPEQRQATLEPLLFPSTICQALHLGKRSGVGGLVLSDVAGEERVKLPRVFAQFDQKFTKRGRVASVLEGVQADVQFAAQRARAGGVLRVRAAGSERGRGKRPAAEEGHEGPSGPEWRVSGIGDQSLAVLSGLFGGPSAAIRCPKEREGLAQGP